MTESFSKDLPGGFVAQRRTTLRDVARAAGVSVATVSKVLNDRADVSAKTRRLVLRSLRESEYRPAGADTGLRRRRRSIEVLAPRTQSAYVMAVLDGVGRAAASLDIDVVLGMRLDERREVDPAALLRSGRNGAIFVVMAAPSSQLAALHEAEFPVVVVDPYRDDGVSVSVGATNFAGGVAATEHLIGLGHRRVAHAAGEPDVDCSQARLAGYASALRRAGIALDESLITHCAFEYEDGRAAAGQLLDRRDPPTAIFAGNDEIALGVMEEARRRSIRVPEDLSIVGFDDTFLAARSAPQLTTVAQPLVEMGVSAVQALDRLLRRDPVGSRHVELATRLVVRDSTAPPR